MPTDRQLEVLRLIAAHLRATQMTPTLRWLMDQLSIASPNGVMCHLKGLAKKGLVFSLGSGLARGWHLTEAGWHAMGLLSPADVELRLRDELIAVRSICTQCGVKLTDEAQAILTDLDRHFAAIALLPPVNRLTENVAA